jgi:NAD-dependent SIR2 family protein deacetylase
MEHQKLIIPREKRILVYNVFNDFIINNLQKEAYPNDFKLAISEITKKRNESILLTTEMDNLYSFIYIHHTGDIETEINVKRPKYPFHNEYND